MGRQRRDELSDNDVLFVLEYLANGRNATRAYMKVHPKAKETTAAVEGSRLLRDPKIDTFLKQQHKDRLERLIVDGDEALIGLSRFARADIRTLFQNNKLLPISQWPEDIADCVKALKPTPFGTSVVLHDKLKARELLAINAGKIRQKHDHTVKFDHAAYLGAEPPEGDD